MRRVGPTASGAIANLAAQGLPFVLLIAVTPILLRILGREQYGALVLFNLVPQIAGQLDLGIVTAATRGFAQYSARGDRDGAMRLFREALLLLIGWGIALGFVFHVGHPWIAAALKLDTIVDDRSAIYLAAALAVPVALANSATLVPLKALERYGRAACIQVAAGVVYWITAATWASTGGTLTQLVTLGTATVAVTTVVLFVAARAAPPARAASSDLVVEVAAHAAGGAVLAADAAPARFLLRPFIGLGAGAFVAQASSLATYHADKLLVSALISPAAAGAYTICTSVANKVLLVVAAGATYTFPRSTRMQAEGGLDAVAATFTSATRLSMLVAVTVGTALIALAPAFLEVWVGADFARDYGTALRLLGFGYVLAASSVVASNVAVGIGQVRIPALFALFGGALTLSAVGVLAPRYGATGAAAAAAIGMAQALVFNDVLARQLGPTARRASWPLLWRLAVTALPVGALAAVASRMVVGWWSLGAVGAAAGAMVLLLWFATFANADERTLVHRFLVRKPHAPHHH